MWSINASHPHCHAQFHQSPPTSQSSHSLDNEATKPPTLPTATSTHVGWQQRQRGVAGWGGAAAGWDSYWVFERWARSSHLPTSSIMPHKRTQIKTTHSCLRSHYHIQTLSGLFSALLSLMWAKALRRKKEDQSSGSPSLLEAMRAPEERARWWSDSCLLV